MTSPAKKVVPAIKVERGIPVPFRNFLNSKMARELYTAFSKMKVGDSFIYNENREPYRIARSMKIKIKSRKQDGTGWRFWLVSKTPISERMR